MTKLTVAAAGLALAVTAGAGIASANPDLGPAVNTTCSYDQVDRALAAQDSAAASEFRGSSATQAMLQQFLAAPPAQRQWMATALASEPANAPYVGLLTQVFNTCNGF